MLDAVQGRDTSVRDTMSKGRFVPGTQHPRIFGRGHINPASSHGYVPQFDTPIETAVRSYHSRNPSLFVSTNQGLRLLENVHIYLKISFCTQLLSMHNMDACSCISKNLHLQGSTFSVSSVRYCGQYPVKNKLTIHI